MVFFGLGSPNVKKFKLADYEVKYKQNPPEIKFRNKSVIIKNIDCIIPDSVIREQPWKSKPIIKIDLLKPETFSIEKNADNVMNIELAAISVPPKIYKDKILTSQNKTDKNLFS